MAPVRKPNVFETLIAAFWDSEFLQKQRAKKTEMFLLVGRNEKTKQKQNNTIVTGRKTKNNPKSKSFGKHCCALLHACIDCISVFVVCFIDSVTCVRYLHKFEHS
jgi:hypothetical protein